MNNKQKLLTMLALTAFALTALFAPWDLTGSSNHYNALCYAPIFAPPDFDTWTKRELANSLFWEWFVLGVIYAGLFVALKDYSPSLRTQTNEPA